MKIWQLLFRPAVRRDERGESRHVPYISHAPYIYVDTDWKMSKVLAWKCFGIIISPVGGIPLRRKLIHSRGPMSKLKDRRGKFLE